MEYTYEYLLGFRNYWSGLANPYEEQTKWWFEWERGWEDAQSYDLAVNGPGENYD